MKIINYNFIHYTFILNYNNEFYIFIIINHILNEINHFLQIEMAYSFF